MYKDFVEFNVGMRRPLGIWGIGSMIELTGDNPTFGHPGFNAARRIPGSMMESAQVRTHLYGYAANDPAHNSP